MCVCVCVCVRTPYVSCSRVWLPFFSAEFRRSFERAHTCSFRWRSLALQWKERTHDEIPVQFNLTRTCLFVWASIFAHPLPNICNTIWGESFHSEHVHAWALNVCTYFTFRPSPSSLHAHLPPLRQQLNIIDINEPICATDRTLINCTIHREDNSTNCLIRATHTLAHTHTHTHTCVRLSPGQLLIIVFCLFFSSPLT